MTTHSQDDDRHPYEGITAEDIADIAPQDVIGFLNERVKNHACPVCGTMKWEVAHSRGVLTGFVQSIPGPGVQPGAPVVPLVLVSCKVCAYVRLHSALVIAKWKQDQGTENG